MTILYIIGSFIYFFIGLGVFSFLFITEWYKICIHNYVWKRIVLFLVCIILWSLLLFCIGIFSFVCLIYSLNDKEKHGKKELKRKVNELNKCYYDYEYGVDYNLHDECQYCMGHVICEEKYNVIVESHN